MLQMISGAGEKRKAQDLLESNLKRVLPSQGVKNIGFPGGNSNEELHSRGAGSLWFAPSGPRRENPIPRYWNSFGRYDPEAGAQIITVETNIPARTNTGLVAGFFARDADTGASFLMHNGRVGGGGKGIGKTAFLAWAAPNLVDVAESEDRYRSAIVLGRLDAPDLADRLWRFVQRVADFKRLAKAGELDSRAFKARLAAYKKYSREFSGRKRGRRRADIDYVTYHGDVVDKVASERAATLRADEQIVKTDLIDLGVLSAENLTELYEVKMSCGRQALYTALGQIVTHAASAPQAKRYLVLPADEPVPSDIDRALRQLNIEVRTFALRGSGSVRKVILTAR